MRYGSSGDGVINGEGRREDRGADEKIAKADEKD